MRLMPCIKTDLKYLAISQAVVSIIISTVLLFSPASEASTPELISVGLDGQATDVDCSDFWPDSWACPANSHIVDGAVSADGRFVAFSSAAQNLVADDVDGFQIFLRDRETDTTTFVTSCGSSGLFYLRSTDAVISADGRYVAFQSDDPLLVEKDTNEDTDIFVYDRLNDTIKRVSVASDGSEAAPCICDDGEAYPWCDCAGTYDPLNFAPSISGDGRTVVFKELKQIVDSGSASFVFSLYRYDVDSGQRDFVIEGMSVAALNHDGNYLVMTGFDSLVPEDPNVYADVYLVELDNTLKDQEICDDGIDNDGDGLIDCSDSTDCADDPACSTTGEPEVCDDNIDNDGDGLTDCLDRLDCRQDPACKKGGGGKNR